MTRLRFIVTGVGNVGRTFLEVLLSRGPLLQERHGVELRAVGVADSSGALMDPAGLELAQIVACKRSGGRVAQLRGGVPGLGAAALVDAADAELLVEATPSSPVDGMPGLAAVRRALARGMHCVLASKGPLVLAYPELAAQSDLTGSPHAPSLRFSGAVGGALPSINLGRRDLAGARITRVEGVLNHTCQLVLALRARGWSSEAALAEARRLGVAEPDASLDLEGWDAAAKLVILAHAVLGAPAELRDVAVRGIADLDDAALRAASAGGARLSLVALAAYEGERLRLEVAPTSLPPEHPLARLDRDELGIVMHSDIFGRTTATSLETGGPLGTAAALLRDALEIAGRLKARGA